MSNLTFKVTLSMMNLITVASQNEKSKKKTWSVGEGDMKTPWRQFVFKKINKVDNITGLMERGLNKRRMLATEKKIKFCIPFLERVLLLFSVIQ